MRAVVVMASPSLSIDDAPMSAFHLRVATYTTGGMFCDGYILGMVGIVLALAAPVLELNAVWKGLIGASALIGIFVGSLVFGPITDRIGRQAMYLADLVAFVVGSVLQFFAQEPWQLFVLRLFMGIAIGADYAIGTALLSEFVPRRQRGALLASLNAVWTVGFVVAYVVGYFFGTPGDSSWRWLLASSALPALLVLLLRLGTPESPRWLLSKGRVDEARRVVTDYFGPEYGIENLSAEPQPGRTRYRMLFARSYRTRTVFAGGFWFCQVLPYFAFFTFLPLLFDSLGFGSDFFAEMVVNLFLLIGAVLGVVVMDLLPRRAFVTWSFVVLIAPLLILGLYSAPPAWLVIACFAFFAIVVTAAGNLESVYPSEIFPTEVRASGVGLAASISRIGAAIGTFLLPLALDTVGVAITMIIAATVFGAGALLSWTWAPETRHVALLEASTAGSPIQATPEPRR